VDERLLERRVDEELSIGDFVLSGGEIAAMALMDAVVRQLPGALGDEASWRGVDNVHECTDRVLQHVRPHLPDG
jgi:tRNA (guanine-N1)-methyltransferase